MADQLLETAHFGLTRIGSGETLSKNGYSFGDLDRVKLDKLIYAALTHSHKGGNAVGDPSDPPTFDLNPSGGHLPASTTFYYRVSYVDEHGLESASSPEGSVTTGDPISPGSAPGGTPSAPGGTLAPGIYGYVYTYLDAYGGETTPSGTNNVAVSQDTTGSSASNSQVALTFGDTLPTNAVSVNVYRSRPGQSGFYYIGNTADPTTFSDGGVVEDQTIAAPTLNTTNANNSIDVTTPLGFFPPGVTAWRLYRTTSSGSYDGVSLVKEVTEGATLSTTTLTTVYTDVGNALDGGFPLDTSACVPPGQLLTLNQLAGRLPLNTTARGAQQLSFFAAGTMTNGANVFVTETPAGMTPVRFTAFFKTPPTETSVNVRFEISDVSSAVVDLDCGPATFVGGDPTGYYHAEFPLITNGEVEAETGTKAGTAFIDDDPTASGAQAVQLVASGDSVDVTFGVLDPGTYHFYANVRVVAFATGASDLSMAVIDTGSNTVLATSSYTFSDTSQVLYQEIGSSPTLTWVSDGVTPIAVRLKKTTSSGQVYDIDWARFAADSIDLDAGQLTVTTIVTGSTAAADANVVVWF